MTRLIHLLAALLFLATPAAAQRKAPLVLAAASLQEAMTDAADAWAKEGHARPVVSFAASSALARQVIAGAPADLFVSADADWMDAVAARGLIVPGTRAVMARNRLVVVGAPASRTLGSVRGAALVRLLGAGPLAMADPDSVPAGKYGRAALMRLGAWGGVAPRVVRAENVRAALALVQRGAAPYAVVYATDARAAPGIRVAGVFPAASHAPIVYPVARLTAATTAEAEGFRRFLLSPRGQAILARRGFERR
ncbi:molybdenum ABC transporter substrate-binding protein [Sphingomonas sp. Leaf412]|uniref:molybdate ABC transporter substrate-binding protein n=1 Tax=Sphingomonas sp. Leaf412 TaxID=1736370 RepID=UPI000728D254|nr:molybdate ABC transporter substrate-binding protein [Sphingomonas sp. Leaf412]KQT33803.1 molybdenum ABC transporter substrate-binding protein [Sphingomonas sp. Leaf412]